MGNTYTNKKDKKIKEIIDKHQQFSDQLKNNKVNKNFLVFNIPIKFDHPRQCKSYIDQIYQSTSDELNNPIYNELYLMKLGIKITNSGHVDFIGNNTRHLKDKLSVLSRVGENQNYISMYKHFDWVENDNENDTENNAEAAISIYVQNIINLQEQIKELEKQINLNKLKIYQTDFVQSQINKQVLKINDYVKTIDYLKNNY